MLFLPQDGSGKKLWTHPMEKKKKWGKKSLPRLTETKSYFIHLLTVVLFTYYLLITCYFPTADRRCHPPTGRKWEEFLSFLVTRGYIRWATLIAVECVQHIIPWCHKYRYCISNCCRNIRHSIKTWQGCGSGGVTGCIVWHWVCAVCWEKWHQPATKTLSWSKLLRWFWTLAAVKNCRSRSARGSRRKWNGKWFTSSKCVQCNTVHSIQQVKSIKTQSNLFSITHPCMCALALICDKFARAHMHTHTHAHSKPSSTHWEMVFTVLSGMHFIYCIHIWTHSG